MSSISKNYPKSFKSADNILKQPLGYNHQSQGRCIKPLVQNLYESIVGSNNTFIFIKRCFPFPDISIQKAAIPGVAPSPTGASAGHYNPIWSHHTHISYCTEYTHLFRANTIRFLDKTLAKQHLTPQNDPKNDPQI